MPETRKTRQAVINAALVWVDRIQSDPAWWADDEDLELIDAVEALRKEEEPEWEYGVLTKKRKIVPVRAYKEIVKVFPELTVVRRRPGGKWEFETPNGICNDPTIPMEEW